RDRRRGGERRSGSLGILRRVGVRRTRRRRWRRQLFGDRFDDEGLPEIEREEAQEDREDHAAFHATKLATRQAELDRVPLRTADGSAQGAGWRATRRASLRELRSPRRRMRNRTGGTGTNRRSTERSG